MSESIAEMILPGTYIEVRAEGLIGVGGIGTGNIGIVGTAAKGPRNQAVVLSSYAEALDTFGPPDAWTTTNKLALVRTLQMAFSGGASTVYAVRIANGEPVKAVSQVLSLGTANSGKAFTLTAKSPGTYANEMSWSSVEVGSGSDLKTVFTLELGGVKEVYEGKTVIDLQKALKESQLVDVGEATNDGAKMKPQAKIKLGEGTGNIKGDDKPAVSPVDVETGLAVLEDEPVNLLLVAGWAGALVADKVGAHLERCENKGKERIAVLGASASTMATVETEAAGFEDDRIVLVAPGIKVSDPVDGADVGYPPPMLAAVVAGKLSTLAPHISLTNKELPLKAIDKQYNEGETKKLLGLGVLAVRRKFGFQVVKSLTTSDKPFDQISIRRTVDYAKEGVRRGCNPYIGRLNNARVRGALKATLDGFLSQMVADEMLTAYQLEVSATRAQEIVGVCAVTMTLLPTFSIDYIRVTMNLA